MKLTENPRPSGEREGPARACAWEGEGSEAKDIRPNSPSPFRRQAAPPSLSPTGRGTRRYGTTSTRAKTCMGTATRLTSTRSTASNSRLTPCRTDVARYPTDNPATAPPRTSRASSRSETTPSTRNPRASSATTDKAPTATPRCCHNKGTTPAPEKAPRRTTSPARSTTSNTAAYPANATGLTSTTRQTPVSPPAPPASAP